MFEPRDKTCKNILERLSEYPNGIPSSKLLSISEYKDRNFYNHIKHLKVDQLVETCFDSHIEKDVLRPTPDGLLQSGKFEQEIFKKIIFGRLFYSTQDNEFGDKFKFTGEDNNERLLDVLNNLLLYLAWQELESGYPWVSILPQISQDISVLFMATELTGINTETLVNKLKGSYVDTMKNKANLVFLLDSIITKIVELDYEDKKSWARTISVVKLHPLKGVAS